MQLLNNGLFLKLQRWIGLERLKFENWTLRTSYMTNSVKCTSWHRGAQFGGQQVYLEVSEERRTEPQHKVTIAVSSATTGTPYTGRAGILTLLPPPLNWAAKWYGEASLTPKLEYTKSLSQIPPTFIRRAGSCIGKQFTIYEPKKEINIINCCSW